MKRCHSCDRTYADDTLSFCLDDGAVLFSASDTDATRDDSESINRGSAPTEVLNKGEARDGLPPTERAPRPKSGKNRKKSRAARQSQTDVSTRADSPPVSVRSGKQANAARSVGTTQPQPLQENERRRAEVSEPVWQAASIFILLLSAFLRIYDYGLKPLHHDEGVNGFFLTRLVREGVYQYNPENYHGPTLYYFALVSTKLFGLNTFAIRLVPALFGVGSVWLVLCLRRYIGAVAALAAAALLAVSPGAVFLSRYFIHESLFVFFTLGIVIAALRFYETTEPTYLMLASASAALLFATKETAIISAGVLLIALIVTNAYIVLLVALIVTGADTSQTGIYARLRKALTGRAEEQEQGRRKRKTGKRTRARAVEPTGLARFGGASRVALLAVAALALFVLVNVLFYSSFFTYSEGVNGALKAFNIWTKTGTSDFHRKPFFTYVKWLWQEEAPLVVLGAAGALLAVWRERNATALFTALWAFGITLAYSLVPYKTPWLTLNLIVPLAITGGYAVSAIYNRWDENERAPLALAVTLGAALAIGGYQMVMLNFYHYDDDTYPYVYAHTRRDLLRLVEDINRIAARAGTGEETRIAITSPDYWPLPWYLRDYKRVGYFGQVTVSGETIIIGSAAEEESLQLQTALGDSYQRIDSYDLRPGVILVLYARRDAAGQ